MDLADLGRGVPHRLLGEGKRQEIVAVVAAESRPTQVIGYDLGLNPVHERLEAPQVLAVDRLRRTYRQGDTVQSYRVVRADTLQDVAGPPPRDHEVLRDRLEPRDVGALGEDRLVVGGTQADADSLKQCTGPITARRGHLFPASRLVHGVSPGEL